MAGIIIYKTNFQHYYCLDFPDQSYRSAKSDILRNKDEILWKKENVTSEQVENIKETAKDLVKKLKEGEKVDLEKELERLFEGD
jgi:hypothetical protein